MKEFSRWWDLKYWLPSHKLKHSPCPPLPPHPPHPPMKCSQTSSSQLKTGDHQWKHYTRVPVPVPCTRAPQWAWLGALECPRESASCLSFWAVMCTTSGASSEPGFVAKCALDQIPAFQVLIQAQPQTDSWASPENWEIHTWKRLGDWEVLRKKHRGRPPLQLENKAHACQGGHTWNLYSQAAALMSAGSVSAPRDGLSEQRKESNHNKVCKASL